MRFWARNNEIRLVRINMYRFCRRVCEWSAHEWNIQLRCELCALWCCGFSKGAHTKRFLVALLLVRWCATYPPCLKVKRREAKKSRVRCVQPRYATKSGWTRKAWLLPIITCHGMGFILGGCHRASLEKCHTLLQKCSPWFSKHHIVNALCATGLRCERGAQSFVVAFSIWTWLVCHHQTNNTQRCADRYSIWHSYLVLPRKAAVFPLCSKT